MPPSGYRNEQSNSICLFLQECSKDLKKEAIDNKESIKEALLREVNDINREIDFNRNSHVDNVIDVLILTKNFYLKLLENNVTFENYAKSVIECLDLIKKGIEGVHIQPYTPEIS